MSFFKNWFIPKPFNEGYLPELDGHNVYFAEFGNPEGEVILTFHGGPGWCLRAYKVKMFDLRRFRVVTFDQRGGAGKSLPAGKQEMNTTQDLLDDTIRLLNYLKINGKVNLFGSSWGTTLALLFAEQYPDLIERIVLSKVFLADKKSRSWELRDNALFYPDILDVIKGDLADNSLIPEYYEKLINSGDKELQIKAAALYGNYENMLGSLNPKIEMKEIDDVWLTAMRIYMYYSARDFMIEDGEIIDNIGKIKNIPTLIVHNRLDFVCPLEGAYRLHKALSFSKLVIVPDFGHGSEMHNKTLKKEIAEFLKGTL